MRKEEKVITWRTVEGVIILKLSYEDLLGTGKFLEDFEGIVVFYLPQQGEDKEVRIAQAVRQDNTCRVMKLGTIPRRLMMSARSQKVFFKIIKDYTSKVCTNKQDYYSLAVDERIWKDFVEQLEEAAEEG